MPLLPGNGGAIGGPLGGGLRGGDDRGDGACEDFIFLCDMGEMLSGEVRALPRVADERDATDGLGEAVGRSTCSLAINGGTPIPHAPMPSQSPMTDSVGSSALKSL